MKIKFNKPRAMGGVDYKAGTHEVPDHVASHWYFLACESNGDIMVLEAAKNSLPVGVNPVTPVEPEVPMESEEKPAKKTKKGSK